MAPATPDDPSGIELSLLDGIDERLLGRLHRVGVRTREDLEARVGAAKDRRALADELGVSRRRIEILHHLNFILPEERANKLFDLEQEIRKQSSESRRGLQSLARVAVPLALLALAGAAAAVVLHYADRPRPDVAPLEHRIETLESRIQVLEPMARDQAEARLRTALSGLGPAPGWGGPLRWRGTDHDLLIQALETAGEEALPVRAVSVALRRLAELENGTGDGSLPVERASAAAILVEDLPALSRVENAWEAAAVLIRQRFRSRSLGLAERDEAPLDILAAAPWPWTSPGFLMAEALTSGLHALPLGAEAFDTWSATVRELREAAAVGAKDLRPRPEAGAQELWLRRAELELAVTASLLGNASMAPYDRRRPRNFLVQRRGFVDGARQLAAGPGRDALAWLAAEYEEALILAVWLDANPTVRQAVAGLPWALALAEIETRREGEAAPAALRTRIADALGQADGPGAWTAGRTLWEAGLRPLLMLTRKASREAASPAAPG